MEENASDLLNHKPAAVFLWLDDWIKEEKAISYDSKINWLGLAEGAAAYACNAFEKHTVVESILWGQIAIAIREQLAKSDSNRIRALGPAMIVRFNLILRFGNHPGDALCDSTIIRNWFFQVLPMNLENAKIEARDWHDKPEERKFELKWIVEWLETLHFLATAGQLQVDSDLQPWLDLFIEIRPPKA